MISDFIEVVATSFGGPTRSSSTFTLWARWAAATRTKLRAALVSKGRGVMVNACSLSNKGTTESTSFLSQVMDNAGFLSIMEHFGIT